jgi:hypothetical protein
MVRFLIMTHCHTTAKRRRHLRSSTYRSYSANSAARMGPATFSVLTEGKTINDNYLEASREVLGPTLEI